MSDPEHEPERKHLSLAYGPPGVEEPQRPASLGIMAVLTAIALLTSTSAVFLLLLMTHSNSRFWAIVPVPFPLAALVYGTARRPSGAVLLLMIIDLLLFLPALFNFVVVFF